MRIRMNVRAKEMAAAIKAETNGRVDLQIFPNNQLGSDTDMLSQMRSGGVEFFTLSGLILATLVPAASINGIGFAFPDYDTVWKAMDGDLGAYVRGAIAKAGLIVSTRSGTTASARPLIDQADQRPRRSQGLQDPRAGQPLWTSMFKAFGRRARRRSTSARSIPRCRPRSSKARKIRWPSSTTAKLYEVQKYCSLTNHMWDGFWFLANRRAWEQLPEDLRTIVAEEHQRGRGQASAGHRQAECRRCSRNWPARD